MTKDRRPQLETHPGDEGAVCLSSSSTTKMISGLRDSDPGQAGLLLPDWY